MIQVVSVLAAMTFLAAYAGIQYGRLRATSLVYTASNAVGGGVLTYVAAHQHQWGFLPLDGVWTIVALVAVPRLVRGPAAV